MIATRIKQERAELIASNKSKHKGFDSIAGYEKEKFILTDSFINLLPLEAAGQDVEFPNSILFFGPIGNGKTSFAKAFANSANCNFVEAKSSKLQETKTIEKKVFMIIFYQMQKWHDKIFLILVKEQLFSLMKLTDLLTKILLLMPD